MKYFDFLFTNLEVTYIVLYFTFQLLMCPFCFNIIALQQIHRKVPKKQQKLQPKMHQPIPSHQPILTITIYTSPCQPIPIHTSPYHQKTISNQPHSKETIASKKLVVKCVYTWPSTNQDKNQARQVPGPEPGA